MSKDKSKDNELTNLLRANGYTVINGADALKETLSIMRILDNNDLPVTERQRLQHRLELLKERPTNA